MNFSKKVTLVFLRLSIGWVFLYAGISKALNPLWSAQMYIEGAKSGGWLYTFFLHPSVLPVVNDLVKYGFSLLGLALIIGVFTRLVAMFGSILMVLLYIPALHFPYVGKSALLIDDHIVYVAVLLVLAAYNAGRVWGLEEWLFKLHILKRFPKLKRYLLLEKN